MNIQKIAAFKKKANTEEIPVDLENWLNNTNNCSQLFEKLGFTLLTDKDVKMIQNPNQMSFQNDTAYFAKKDVLAQVVFVAKNQKNNYFGYSLLDNDSILISPIVSSTDYFTLEPGNLIEALLMDLVKDEIAYNQYKKDFEKCGFQLRSFEDLFNDDVYENYTDPDDLMTTLIEGRDLSNLEFNATDSLEWSNPKFGIENPSIINSDHWTSCIYSKKAAYVIRNEYNTRNIPVWCFSRFGQSITRINGKEIFIGGEHEDYYDEDFYIYNDVVVVNSDNSVEIYNYPKDIFPPTDFHSASLINDQTILIIGSLGYQEERQYRFTPVYALNINDFKIEKVITHGEFPGWIYEHKAILSEDNTSIKIVGGNFVESENLLENIDEWELDLETFKWTRLTDRKWKCWEVKRKDKQHNYLWDIRNELFEISYLSKLPDEDKKMENVLGYPIDLKKVEEIYQFKEFPSYQKIPKDYDNTSFYRIKINDITIRFDEKRYRILVTIEGDLEDEIIEILQNKLLKKLAELENCEYVLEKYY